MSTGSPRYDTLYSRKNSKSETRIELSEPSNFVFPCFERDHSGSTRDLKVILQNVTLTPNVLAFHENNRYRGEMDREYLRLILKHGIMISENRPQTTDIFKHWFQLGGFFRVMIERLGKLFSRLNRFNF
ncbi:hypothetical protein NPIL_287611 [Nephila pilipes]|uniref:Uncharacterized protein n=1 Tax=Nephila pilipes TaxID=299642 RepID=A0A8X6NNS3_NEPPI|nr:hypothetical protein NPIL_287611 [Nephila pilipes]